MYLPLISKIKTNQYVSIILMKFYIWINLPLYQNDCQYVWLDTVPMNFLLGHVNMTCFFTTTLIQPIHFYKIFDLYLYQVQLESNLKTSWIEIGLLHRIFYEKHQFNRGLIIKPQTHHGRTMKLFFSS